MRSRAVTASPFPLSRGELSVAHPRPESVADDEVERLRALEQENLTLRRRVAELEEGVARAADPARLASDLGAAVALVDEAGRVAACTDGFAQLLGATEREVRGSDLSALVHPEDRGEFGIPAAPYTVERRYVGRGGRVVWVREHGAAAAGLPGPPLAFVAITDRTSRTAADLALRESERKHRIVADNTHDFEFWREPGGGYVYVSPSCVRVTGYPPEAFLSDPHLLASIVLPEDQAVFAELTSVASAHDHRGEIEFRIRHRDGSVRWIAKTFQGVFGEDGAYLGLRGSNRDVTARKVAEEALRRAESGFRALFDAIDEAFCLAELVLDADGRPVDYRFIQVNQRFLEMSGFENAVGRTAREIVPTLEHAWIERYAHVALDGAAIRFEQESDTTGRRYDVFVAPAEPRGRFALVFTDVTDRRRAEEALRASEEALRAADRRRKDQFLATLAHELRNPLAPIRTGLRLMAVAQGNEAILSKTRAMMERQVDHLVRLVDDLLDVSRITRDRLEILHEPILLADVLRTAIETARPLIDELGHDLVVELPPEPLVVNGDVVRLAQVFANLLDNAAKYTDREGRIRLSVGRQGGAVVVAVRDTGIGLAPEQIPQMFAMFTQLDASIARARGGLGIGLTLVKRLVELHGGAVAVSSEGLGRGAEFAVTLPLATTVPPSKGSARTAPVTDRDRRAVEVLIVDDNEDGAEALALLVERAGFRVRVVHDGGAALAAATEQHPHVILLDIGLPILDGYQVCEAIRREPWGGDVRIIAVTGWGQDTDRIRSRRAGFDDHLVKPVDPPHLLALLDTFV